MNFHFLVEMFCYCHVYKIRGSNINIAKGDVYEVTLGLLNSLPPGAYGSLF